MIRKIEPSQLPEIFDRLDAYFTEHANHSRVLNLEQQAVEEHYRNKMFERGMAERMHERVSVKTFEGISTVFSFAVNGRPPYDSRENPLRPLLFRIASRRLLRDHACRKKKKSIIATRYLAEQHIPLHLIIAAYNSSNGKGLRVYEQRLFISSVECVPVGRPYEFYVPYDKKSF